MWSLIQSKPKQNTIQKINASLEYLDWKGTRPVEQPHCICGGRGHSYFIFRWRAKRFHVIYKYEFWEFLCLPTLAAKLVLYLYFAVIEERVRNWIKASKESLRLADSQVTHGFIIDTWRYKYSCVHTRSLFRPDLLTLKTEPHFNVI